MKKYSFLIVSAMTASLILAACGTTDEAQPVEEEKTGSTVVEETKTSSNITEEVDADEKSTPPSTDTSTTTEKVEQTEQTEPAESTQPVEPVTTQKPAPTATEATYTASPEQKYEIALQQGYSLVAEEPGRDMVVSDSNDQISMRVETFAKTEASYEEMAKLAQETVTVTAPEGKYDTVDLTALLAKNSDVLNAAAYKIGYTEDAEQAVTAIFEKADKIVQLTIFDTTDNAFTNTLLEIGFSIR